jgi:hypothetical protein
LAAYIGQAFTSYTERRKAGREDGGEAHKKGQYFCSAMPNNPSLCLIGSVKPFWNLLTHSFVVHNAHPWHTVLNGIYGFPKVRVRLNDSRFLNLYIPIGKTGQKRVVNLLYGTGRKEH